MQGLLLHEAKCRCISGHPFLQNCLHLCDQCNFAQNDLKHAVPCYQQGYIEDSLSSESIKFVSPKWRMGSFKGSIPCSVESVPGGSHCIAEAFRYVVILIDWATCFEITVHCE